jgi:hypothetical protein
MASTYRNFMINFGWYANDEHTNLNEAIEAARKTGFEVRIDKDQTPVASWSVIGGLRYY